MNCSTRKKKSEWSSWKFPSDKCVCLCLCPSVGTVHVTRTDSLNMQGRFPVSWNERTQPSPHSLFPSSLRGPQEVPREFLLSFSTPMTDVWLWVTLWDPQLCIYIEQTRNACHEVMLIKQFEMGGLIETFYYKYQYWWSLGLNPRSMFVHISI